MDQVVRMETVEIFEGKEIILIAEINNGDPCREKENPRIN